MFGMKVLNFIPLHKSENPIYLLMDVEYLNPPIDSVILDSKPDDMTIG